MDGLINPRITRHYEHGGQIIEGRGFSSFFGKIIPIARNAIHKIAPFASDIAQKTLKNKYIKEAARNIGAEGTNIALQAVDEIRAGKNIKETIQNRGKDALKKSKNIIKATTKKAVKRKREKIESRNDSDLNKLYNTIKKKKKKRTDLFS